MAAGGGIGANIRARGTKDVLSPKKWKVYLLSWLRERLLGSQEEQVARAEQLIYRMTQCATCVAVGECTVCHCPIPAAMIEPANTCAGGQWGKMLTPDEWEKFKQEQEIVVRSNYL